MKLTENQVRRFWSHVRKDANESGCWLWTRARKNGYGTTGFTIEGKFRSERAHRVAYALTYGPIPEGWEVDHVCKVRDCVRPDHLEALPRNAHQRRWEKEPQATCRKGHPRTQENAYWYKGYPTCRICQNSRRKARVRARVLAADLMRLGTE